MFSGLNLCWLLLNIRHQLAQPLLPGMGVNLRSDNAFMPKQGLNIDQLYVFFQQTGDVSTPEFLRRTV